jgi:hypothetical protein
MTIEECLRKIVREEMRPVELKLSLMASLVMQLCKELDAQKAQPPVFVIKPANRA